MINRYFVKKYLEYLAPDRKYNNFLRGKRVVIVGPSKHILLKEPRINIDDYDVVVRFKWLPPPQNEYKKFIGSKTNVIYSSKINQEKDFNILNSNKVEQYRHMQNWYTNNIPINNQVVAQLFPSLCTALQSHPHWESKSESQIQKMVYDILRDFKNTSLLEDAKNFKFKNLMVYNYSSEKTSLLLRQYASETNRNYYKLRLNDVNTSFCRPQLISLWPTLGFQAVLEILASQCQRLHILGMTLNHGCGHMLQKDKPENHGITGDKHDGILETLILSDIVKYFQDIGQQKITMDSVLKSILDKYRDLELQKIELNNRNKVLNSAMKEIITTNNNLTRGLD